MTSKKNLLSDIIIKGARVNNLKNIDVTIPQGKLVVITGLSGSGKSSLAFDTLYAEGQRRYVESLSSYARQFLGRMNKPDVDYIHGISPAVAIEQRVNTSNPRSTVGTSTEIYEYLKLLYARIGRTFSPISGVEVCRHTVSDVVDHVYAQPDNTLVLLLAPLTITDDRPLLAQLEMLRQEGFQRVMVKGSILLIDDFIPLAQKSEHAPKKRTKSDNDIQLLVDRIVVNAHDDDQHSRVAESVQTAFFEGRGECIIHISKDDANPIITKFSNRFEADGIAFEKPNPNFFSFNNPYGACPTCQGYGSVIGIDENLVVPNKSLSVYEDAVICWRGEKMQEWKKYFIRHANEYNFPIHTPYCELTQEQHDVLWHGSGAWEGIDGFFKEIEEQSYKIQYRVMLSRFRGKTTCPSCHDSRLRKDTEYVKICGCSITDLVRMPILELAQWLTNIETQLTPTELEATTRLRLELHNRIGYLVEVGLGYLTLHRHSSTLSGGESQRINLATSLGSSLVGSMYILDEPSIGLHSRDTDKLISVLRKLRDLGNTVIVVEHDEDIIRAADYVIDIGPDAGSNGGQVVYAGTIGDYNQQASNDSLASQSYTLQYLSGQRFIAVPTSRRPWRDKISVIGAFANNLKHINVDFPLGVMTVVTGVSGSGKTSLVKHVLYDCLSRQLDDNPEYTGNCMKISGDLSRISNIELIDQNPIGKSSRSNPATYMKAYEEIRALYAAQPLAKARGYRSGYFSFNTEGGRCEHCQGEGIVTIGMQFMADLHLVCDECHGTRFKEDTLEITYHDINVSQVLEMSVDEAVAFFRQYIETDTAYKHTLQSIVEHLEPLQAVGLGYLKLGQSSNTLSGGEAQRIKLASYLVHGQTSNHRLFIFDEPSTGLHFHDIQKLIAAFNQLISKGHTIIVIEHHPDIIKVADWVIDMGPEGGNNGGRVVFQGTPENLANHPESYTAKFLKGKLNKQNKTLYK
ncbi:MAG: excinuclease ABC subunit UvrA [Bacteroidales bacterium]|nr:excinuclease ABC subunit UvrA [Candidatus Colimorpha onthohippi]